MSLQTREAAFLSPAERAERDDLAAPLDERTREILAHRRKSPGIRRRGWLVRRMLAAADIFGLVSAFLLAELLLGTRRVNMDHIALRFEILAFMLTIPGWIVVAKIYGLYDRDEEQADRSTADDVVAVFHMITVGAWLVFAAAWASELADPDFPKLALFWVLAITLVSTARGAARAYCRRQIAYIQNTVIVGAGDVGQLMARKILKHPEYGINLVGFVDDEPKERQDDLEHLTLLGPTYRLPGFVRLLDIERVVIAFSNDAHEDTLDLIRVLKDLDVQVDIVPRMFELLGPTAKIHTVEGMPVVGLPPFRLSRSSKLLKRGIDVALSLLAVVALAPVFGVVALLIRLTSPGPVFFRQVRMGTDEKTFRIYKFRTMVADAEERKHEVAHLNQHLRNGGDARMFKVLNDPRITPIGHFLRRTSLDELPQLFNVIKGEMSLVGPRPLILDEDQHVSSWARQRLSLKPGITGPWQVLGRSGIPFDEMVKLDYLYVTGWSLYNDLKLIIRTLPVSLRGANEPGRGSL